MPSLRHDDFFLSNQLLRSVSDWLHKGSPITGLVVARNLTGNLTRTNGFPCSAFAQQAQNRGTQLSMPGISVRHIVSPATSLDAMSNIQRSSL